MSTRALTFLALCLAAVTFTAGCRQNMHNQNKLEPYESSSFFTDGQGSRKVPPGTVPRGTFGAKIAPYTGLAVAPPAPPGPPRVTMELLRRGRDRYDVFCSPCHDRVGTGRGMIVRRGYKQPPSLHDARLRGVPADYFVQVIAEGFGVMPAYAEEVAPHDRWAIAAYIRALQYSENARLAQIPSEAR